MTSCGLKLFFKFPTTGAAVKYNNFAHSVALADLRLLSRLELQKYEFYYLLVGPGVA